MSTGRSHSAVPRISATTEIPERFLNVKGDAPRENIEIVCSHCGMGVNPLVLIAIADRLAEKVKDWVPFDPLNYAAGPLRKMSRWFYPSSLKPGATGATAQA